MKFSTVALLSALAAVTSALTPPNYEDFPQPEGNPILMPGLNEIVPAGEPYTILWNPTTQGHVSLQLLRGPAENAVPIATIVESIPNRQGHYIWTPSTDLEPDTTRYGILLVVEETGQYQYTTQFGISNDLFTPPESSNSEVPDVPEPTESEEPVEPTTTSAPVEPPVVTSVPIRTFTITDCDCDDDVPSVPAPTNSGIAPTGGIPIPTGQTSTYLANPTPTPGVPTGPGVPDFGNSAGRNTVGLFGGAVVAVAALLAV